MSGAVVGVAFQDRLDEPADLEDAGPTGSPNRSARTAATSAVLRATPNARRRMCWPTRPREDTQIQFWASLRLRARTNTTRLRSSWYRSASSMAHGAIRFWLDRL